jgi:hypothetical protein
MHTARQAQEVIASLKSQPEAFVLTRKKRTPPSDLDAFFLDRYEAVWAGHGFILLRAKPD